MVCQSLYLLLVFCSETLIKVDYMTLVPLILLGSKYVKMTYGQSKPALENTQSKTCSTSLKENTAQIGFSQIV